MSIYGSGVYAQYGNQSEAELKERREVAAKLTAIENAHQAISINLGIWTRNRTDKAARKRISEAVRDYQAALNAALHEDIRD
jgi:hypothetical protein